MHALFAGRAGDNLHRASAIVAPSRCPDLAHAAPPGGKQRRMPRKEPFSVERLVVVARGVEHHFHDAFDVAVGGFERANIHAEASGKRGPDLFRVQLLPFDFTALEHVRGQRLQLGFLAEVEAEGFHMADQPALLVTDCGERFGKAIAAPMKLRPVLKLMDVQSTHYLRRL